MSEPYVACAVLHTDAQGNPVSCPGYPHVGELTEPHTGLVVQPYRNDRGENVWVFRCWGTDTCDGSLSLDHFSQESAERARDRHVAESHPELTLLRDMDDCRFCGEHEGSINHPGSQAVAQGAPGHEYSPPTQDRQPATAAKLSDATAEDRLRAAEIRAAVAEHEAEAYRNQVQALVRELLRMRDVPEEDLPQKVSVIILDEEAS